MADEVHHTGSTIIKTEEEGVEKKDRGLFGFGGTKEEDKKETKEEAVIATEFEKVHVSEPEHKEEDKKPSPLEKFERSSSTSSSSGSDEEVVEGGEKKKKKKTLKEKICAEHKEEDTTVPIEICDEPSSTHEPEEKKGFLDKIKGKLPGGQKKTEEVVAPPPPAEFGFPEGEAAKEKKGIFEKIKEKLPGSHSKTEEEKEKEKE